MKKRSISICYLAVCEALLLILASISLAVLLNGVLVSAQIIVVPSDAGALNLIKGESVFKLQGVRDIKTGEVISEPVKVLWKGTASDGSQIGVTSSGREVGWKNFDSATLKGGDVESISSLQQQYWGKTFSFQGQDYSISEAIGNPSSIKNFVGNDGQLTVEAGDALSPYIKNPVLQNNQIVSGSAPYSYEPFGFNLGFFSSNFFFGNLIQGVVWSVAVVGIIQLVGNLAGLDADLTNTLSVAAAAGIVGGKAAYGLFGAAQAGTPGSGGILTEAIGGSIGPWTAGAIGAIIAVAVFVLMYSKESKKLVSFQCLPFEPPIGGAKCEECNKDSFRPCSEYRCRSLGQACQLLNPGTNEERCVWVNPKDVNSPTISPWTEALKPSGLSYIPDNTIRPPNRGVKITKVGAKEGCIQAFTPLEFGVILNEPAQCKIDYNPNKTFENMEFYFGGSNYHRYNHTQKIKLPAPETGETAEGLAPELKNNGFFSLFVQCRDANGNENVDKFVFNFCVDKSPDTTPPVIEGTSIKSGGFVRNNADKIPIEVYTNEPAECKWSRDSKSYTDMENSMSCSTETFQINSDLNYVCSGNLTGIKNQQDNKFYFRCKDQPDKPENERNVNTQSHELVLKGSQPLNILSTAPNGTIFGSTDTVTVDLIVKTDDGAEEGKSICYFSTAGLPDSYIAMFGTNSFEHRQKLDLISGNYKYFFRCIDYGGNSAESSTEFAVQIDKQSPIITRAYKEEGLKIVTNEEAECVYSLTSCNYVFDEGLPMIYSNPSIKTNHFIEWQDNKAYYIKCGDLYKNQPSPNECNIVINSVELIRKTN